MVVDRLEMGASESSAHSLTATANATADERHRFHAFECLESPWVS